MLTDGLVQQNVSGKLLYGLTFRDIKAIDNWAIFDRIKVIRVHTEGVALVKEFSCRFKRQYVLICLLSL